MLVFLLLRFRRPRRQLRHNALDGVAQWGTGMSSDSHRLPGDRRSLVVTIQTTALYLAIGRDTTRNRDFRRGASCTEPQSRSCFSHPRPKYVGRCGWGGVDTAAYILIFRATVEPPVGPGSALKGGAIVLNGVWDDQVVQEVH